MVFLPASAITNHCPKCILHNSNKKNIAKPKIKFVLFLETNLYAFSNNEYFAINIPKINTGMKYSKNPILNDDKKPKQLNIKRISNKYFFFESAYNIGNIIYNDIINVINHHVGLYPQK